MIFIKSKLLSLIKIVAYCIWFNLPDKIRLMLIEKKTYRNLDYNTKDLKLILSSTVSLQRMNSCKKEPETVKWILENLKPDGVFYDIGSNTGAYSLIASTILNEKGKVVAFEPVPSTFIELCQNIQINQLENKIIPLNIALDNKNLIVNFGINSFSGGEAMHIGLSSEKLLTNNHNAIFHFLLETKVLDEVIREYNIPQPTMIKLDVDGPEFNILKGAINTLKSNSLRTIQVEIDQVNQPIKEIITFLEEYGLYLTEKHKHGENEIYDFVFTKKN